LSCARSGFFEIFNLFLQLADNVGRFLNRFVALFQLVDQQTINPHQLFVFFLQPLCPLYCGTHGLNLGVQFCLTLSPVVKLQFEIEVLLRQAIHLLVQFSGSRHATLAASGTERAATAAAVDIVWGVPWYWSQWWTVIWPFQCLSAILGFRKEEVVVMSGSHSRAKVGLSCAFRSCVSCPPFL
jgi:hypothetical protein